MGVYNCYQPFTGYSATAYRGDMGNLTAVGGATPTKTSEWLDISNWENKVISWEVDSAGTIDWNLGADISSQHAYELNNKTCTTDDYVNVVIKNAHADALYTRVDTTDFDDLQRPIRAIRFIIDNDQAEPVTGCQVFIEGWSPF